MTIDVTTLDIILAIIAFICLIAYQIEVTILKRKNNLLELKVERVELLLVRMQLELERIELGLTEKDKPKKDKAKES